MNKPEMAEAASSQVRATFKLIHEDLTQLVSISSHFASKYSQFYAGHILSMVLRMSPVEGKDVRYLRAMAEIMTLVKRPTAFFISKSHLTGQTVNHYRCLRPLLTLSPALAGDV